ncbi:hypothetical protein AOLI_G00012810 [Acnodon oligacanthus]
MSADLKQQRKDLFMFFFVLEQFYRTEAVPLTARGDGLGALEQRFCQTSSLGENLSVEQLKPLRRAQLHIGARRPPRTAGGEDGGSAARRADRAKRCLHRRGAPRSTKRREERLPSGGAALQIGRGGRAYDGRMKTEAPRRLCRTTEPETLRLIRPPAPARLL